MTDKHETSPAEALYAEGMKYNWRQNESPANATLSRANLERAHALGHTKATRELAEMVFAGSGGPKNQERALWLKWSACVRDEDSLEELAALLDSYAENVSDSGTQARASNAARKTEEAYEKLRYVGSFIHELCRTKLQAPGNE